jgi:hypothetical protein
MTLFKLHGLFSSILKDESTHIRIALILILSNGICSDFFRSQRFFTFNLVNTVGNENNHIRQILRSYITF